MVTAISVPVQTNRSLATQLAADLRAACASLSTREWLLLVGRCAVASAVQTTRCRARNLRDAASSVVKTGRRYVRNGVRQSARDDIQQLGKTIAATPTAIRQSWRRFRSLTRGQQTDEVIGLCLTWGIFWAVAGGADLEGGLPDLDLKLGIGAHRNVFSHTVFLGLETEMTMRLAVGLLDELIQHMPNNRHPVWGKVAGTIARYQERAITAVWAGIGAHLLKDAGLLHLGATKPVTGLPFHMPMEAHQAFLAANGVAAEVIAASPGQARPTASQSVQPSSSGTAQAQAALCCIAGPCVGATIVLKVGTVHIGRSPGSDIALASDPTVSRQHAAIERTAVGWEVRDLGSTNGTRVNGVVVRQALLRPGDTLAFGRSLFRFDA
jgi:hypothetical protein